MNRTIVFGAVAGLGVGMFILAGVLGLAVRCLPWRLSLPTSPWPWYCADPAYSVLLYLAFPVNLLTNDLMRAIMLAPLALVMYTLFGIAVAILQKRRISAKSE